MYNTYYLYNTYYTARIIQPDTPEISVGGVIIGIYWLLLGYIG